MSSMVLIIATNWLDSATPSWRTSCNRASPRESQRRQRRSCGVFITSIAKRTARKVFERLCIRQVIEIQMRKLCKQGTRRRSSESGLRWSNSMATSAKWSCSRCKPIIIIILEWADELVGMLGHSLVILISSSAWQRLKQIWPDWERRARAR